MELQNIFYAIGIIAMTLWIVIIVTGLILIYKIQKATNSFKSSFKGKIIDLFKEKNVEIASALGLTLGHFVIDKIRKKNKEK